MTSKATLRNIDLILKVIFLSLWGAVIVFRMISESLILNILLLPIFIWTITDAWQEWRNPIEDERVRHIVLISGYVSREFALVAAALLMMFSQIRPVNSRTWMLVMLALLLLPDMAVRRYLGLRNEELTRERPQWQGSLLRIFIAAASCFALLAGIATLFIITRHP